MAGEDPPENPFGSLPELIEEDARYRESAEFSSDRQYWQEAFVAELDGQGAVPAVRQEGLVRCVEHLDPDVAEALRGVANQWRTSLARLIIALTVMYRSRRSGNSRVSIGIAVNGGRRSQESVSTPGMTANIVPQVIAVSSESPAQNLCAEVSKQLSAGLKHQRYRYEDIARDAGLLNRGRLLVDTVANFIPFAFEAKIAAHRVVMNNTMAGQVDDLAINVFDRGRNGGLRIHFDGNPALHDEQRLADELRYYVRLLESVAKDPDQRVGECDALGPEERRRLLAEANGPALDVPPVTVPELFQARAAQVPGAVAVEDEAGAVGYGELNARANRLAHMLIARGVGPEDLVGLAVPRSAEMPPPHRRGVDRYATREPS